MVLRSSEQDSWPCREALTHCSILENRLYTSRDSTIELSLEVGTGACPEGVSVEELALPLASCLALVRKMDKYPPPLPLSLPYMAGRRFGPDGHENVTIGHAPRQVRHLGESIRSVSHLGSRVEQALALGVAGEIGHRDIKSRRAGELTSSDVTQGQIQGSELAQ